MFEINKEGLILNGICGELLQESNDTFIATFPVQVTLGKCYGWGTSCDSNYAVTTCELNFQFEGRTVKALTGKFSGPGLPCSGSFKACTELMAVQKEIDMKRKTLTWYVEDMDEKTSNNGPYACLMHPLERENFHAQLMEIKDWLYQEKPAPEDVQELNALGNWYDKNLQEFRKFCALLTRRDHERHHLSREIAALWAKISELKTIVESPEIAQHFSTANIAMISEAGFAAAHWLWSMQEKQAGLQVHDVPVLFCDDLREQTWNLHTLVAKICKEENESQMPQKESSDAQIDLLP